MLGFRRTARALIDMGERRTIKTTGATHYHTHHHYGCCECPRRPDPPAEGPALGVVSAELDEQELRAFFGDAS